MNHREPTAITMTTAPAGAASLAELRDRLQRPIEPEQATVPPYLCALCSLAPERNPETVESVRGVLAEDLAHRRPGSRPPHHLRLGGRRRARLADQGDDLRAVECGFVPVKSSGGRSQGWDDSGFVVEGVRVHSALLRLDGVFEPPYLVVDGEIDISTLAPFTTALSSMLEHGSGDVWIDVEKLSFIDVGGLRALATAACRLQIQDRRLVLRSVAPHLVKLMDLVGWSQIPNLLMLARETGLSSSGAQARRPQPRAHDE